VSLYRLERKKNGELSILTYRLEIKIPVNSAAWPWKSEELMLILVVRNVNKVGSFDRRGKEMVSTCTNFTCPLITELQEM
jgi:hypothetical protein